MTRCDNFVVAWESDQQDGSGNGVFARRFDASGQAQAAEFQVTTYTSNDQAAPTVGMDPAGAFAIAWDSLDQDGDGTVAPLTDGLLVLRYLFGFTSTTLTAGAVAVACTRCDPGSIKSYLDTLI